MVAFGFGELRLQSIWARCVVENVASYRVLERAVCEGRTPAKEEWMKGRWWAPGVRILDHHGDLVHDSI